jgi:cysteinyl-tRNA synthetase
MAIRLFDSLSRTIRDVAPDDGQTFRFYCCGPTVYGPSHIGNFRAFILQDVLRRTLEADGMKVMHVRNLTDVDDKTIRGARAEGLPLTDFTRRWTSKFHEDCEALNLLKPHVEPAATAHIPQQIALIEKLIARDHAYATPEGSVYFRVSSFDEYGKLSRLKEREIKTGAAAHEESAPVDADEYQRDSAADFALWKARKPEDGDVFWPSPWGEGRPGWHIECSAMSMEYLGETFDLHGGGIDLVFPHHENEIAQSEACTCKPLARHWFHNAHLLVDGHKMSKSLGNLYTLEDIRQKGFSPAALRYVLLSGHYRQPLNFTLDSLHSAESAIDKLRRYRDAIAASVGDAAAEGAAGEGRDWSQFADAWASLSEDLNTPAALGEVFRAIRTAPSSLPPEEARKAAHAFHAILKALGLDLIAHEKKAEIEIPPAVAALAEQRWQAKQNRDFASADRLREELKQAGWTILDRKDGYSLEPLKP